VRTLATSLFVDRVAGELAAHPRRRRDPVVARLVSVDAHEGPVFVAGEEALYFTSVPRPSHDGPLVDVRRLDLRSLAVSVIRHDANAANGMCLGRDGSLIVCEQGSFTREARIARMDPLTGATETLVDSWRGRPLNSPNDVVVHSDGTIWFTDPSYGFVQGFRPKPSIGDQVYRHDPASGRTVAVARGLDKPNGLAFSADERTLYVADNGAPHRLYAYDVRGSRLTGRRVVTVTTPEHPDGVKVDHLGRIFSTSARGIEIRSASGRLIRELALPGAVNFCFGAPGQLFITTDEAIWLAKGV
jgi:gluconolactonase